jgi:cephalosporin hydroxylase
VQNKWCKTSVAKQVVQNKCCKTSGAKQVVQNKWCKTSVAKQVVQNKWCKTSGAKQVVQNNWRKIQIWKSSEWMATNKSLVFRSHPKKVVEPQEILFDLMSFHVLREHEGSV